MKLKRKTFVVYVRIHYKGFSGNLTPTEILRREKSFREDWAEKKALDNIKKQYRYLNIKIDRIFSLEVK